MSFGALSGFGGGQAPVPAGSSSAASPIPTPSSSGGILSGLFQGSPIPPQPTGSDTSTQYPLWLQQYVYNLSNAASNLSGSEYSQFPGQQVATPSSATQQAWQMAQGNVGAYQPALGQAFQQTQAGSAPLTAAGIQQYMSPYTSNVIGALQQASQNNFEMNQLPSIQSRFVSAGQSRSPQEREADNRALYLNNQALDQSVAGALNQGYQSAVNTATQQQGLQLQGGAQLGALGQLQQQLGGYDVGQLAAAGQGQDTANQANINAAMNNFYAQQQWPYQNLAFASNIIRGQPVASNTQTVGLTPPSASAYTASPLAAFIGGTLGGSALANSGTSPKNAFRRGGHVARGALGMAANENRPSSVRVA